MKNVFTPFRYLLKKWQLCIVLLFALLSIGNESWGQATGDFRSFVSGNWNAPGTWERFSSTAVWQGNGVGENTGLTPSASNAAFIQTAHLITLTQNESVGDLHLCSGTTSTSSSATQGKIALASFTLNVNGKLRNYYAASGVIPGTASTNGFSVYPFTTPSTGKISIVGSTRTVLNSGEWGSTINTATTGFFPLEVNMTAGQTATFGTNVKSTSFNLVSGIVDAQSLSFDNGTAGQGDITIAVGTTLISSGSSTAVFQRTGTTLAGTVNLNGTLRLTGAAPVMRMTTINFNGTVEYSSSGSQTLVAPGSSGANTNTYNNLIIGGGSSSVKTTNITGSLITTVNGKLTMNGTSTLSAFAVGVGGSLVYGAGATLEYAKSSSAGVGAEWPAASGPTNINITTNGVSFAAAATISNVALTSNVATITTGTHGFYTGQTVTISSVPAPNAVLNGTYTITSTPSTTTFTYALTNANITSTASTGGASIPAFNRTVTGNFTLNGAAFTANTGNSITMANGSTITKLTANNFNSSGGVYNIGTASTDIINVVIGSAVATPVTITGSSELQGVGATLVGSANLTIFPGFTYSMNSASRTVLNLALNGTLSDAAVLAAGTLTVKGNITGTGNQVTSFTTGKILMSGNTIASNISGATFDNLELNDADGFTLTGSPTVNNQFALTNGALAVGGNTLTLNGPSTTGTGTLTTTSSSNLIFGGSNAGPVNMPLGVSDLNNLTVNNTNGTPATINELSSITIAGTLALTSGSLALGSNTLSLNGPAISGSGTLTTTSASSLSFGGSTAALSIPSSVTALNNLTLNNASATLTANSSIVMAGNLTITAGTLAGGANTLTVAGNLAGTGICTNSGSGLISMTGASKSVSALTLGNIEIVSGASMSTFGPTITGTFSMNGGNVVINGGSTLRMSNNSSIVRTSGNLSLSGGLFFVGTSSTDVMNLTINGNLSSTVEFPGGSANPGRIALLTINPGITYTLSSSNKGVNNLALNGNLVDDISILTVRGNLTGTGVHSGTGKILMSGNTVASNISGATFSNLELNDADGFTLTGNPIVNGTLALTNGALTMTGQTLTMAAAGTVDKKAGSLGLPPTYGAGTSVTFSGTSATSGNELAPSAGSIGLLTMSCSGIYTLGSGPSVTNLALTSGTLADGGFTITNSGNITGTGIHTGAGKIVMTGNTVASNISGATFANLELNDADGFTLTGNPTVNGTLTLTNGALTMTGQTLTMAAAGTVDRKAGSLGLPPIYGAGTSVTFSGTSATSGNELAPSAGSIGLLTMSGSGIYTLGSGLSVTNLALTSGTLEDGGFTITNSGNITGTGIHTGAGKIVMAGNTVASNISGATFANLELNDADGFTLTGNPTVNGSLSLTNGIVSTNANTVTIAATGSTSRTNGWVNGNLKMNLAAAGSQDYFVGTASTYNPAKITYSGGPAEDFTVAVNTAYPPNTPNPSVNRIWNISETTPGGNSIFLQLNFNAGEEEAGMNNPVYLVHNDVNTAIDARGDDNTLTFPLTGQQTITSGTFAFSAFSPFGVSSGSVILPIGDLLYFDAKKSGNTANINWNVAPNHQFTKYEVMRGVDGRNFNTIGSLNNLNNQTAFQFADTKLAGGTNYYKLKMTEKNGAVTYSKVVAIVNRTNGIELIGVAPSVVKNGIAYLIVAAANTTKMAIMITDISGRKAGQITRNVVEGNNSLPLDLQFLSAGIYNITGFVNGEKTSTIRFIKQ